MVPQRGTSGIAKGLELQGRKYETMDKFCYLGDMLAARGGETAAVTARIQSVWKKFCELSPILTWRATPLKVKGKVYDACVRKYMIYGSETWAMKSSSIERMEKAEMKMDVQDITMWKKEKWRPPPANGPGKDRTGDEEEQTEMVWTCG